MLLLLSITFFFPFPFSLSAYPLLDGFYVSVSKRRSPSNDEPSAGFVYLATPPCSMRQIFFSSRRSLASSNGEGGAMFVLITGEKLGQLLLARFSAGDLFVSVCLFSTIATMNNQARRRRRGRPKPKKNRPPPYATHQQRKRDKQLRLGCGWAAHAFLFSSIRRAHTHGFRLLIVFFGSLVGTLTLTLPTRKLEFEKINRKSK